MTGMIFDIQRFSIHDGPGIRTTVFFKGCPLRCVWCHNPEGIGRKRELSFSPDKCIACGYCVSACPNDAHKLVDGRHEFDRERCKLCGDCATSCYPGALEMIGREVSVEEIMEVVLADRAFYATSGGGLTLSGGEPLAQPDVAEALLAAAKAEDIHSCVETCGFADFSDIERIRPLVDLFLYDVKDTDGERHIETTGAPNDLILDNLKRLHDAGSEILLRVPMVPGYNDRADSFRGLARLADDLPNLRGIELLPYHRLGINKRRRIGMSEQDAITSDTPDAETVASWIRTLDELGVRVVNRSSRKTSN